MKIKKKRSKNVLIDGVWFKYSQEENKEIARNKE